MHDDLLSTITIEDLPQDLQAVAQTIGLEPTVELIRYFRGTSLHIPRLALLPAIERYVLQRYDGHNAVALARQTEISQRMVYKILSNHGRTRRSTQRGSRTRD